MNKWEGLSSWIDEQAEKYEREWSHEYPEVRGPSFTAGAHAALEKVKEIVSEVKANYPEDIFEPLKKDDIMPSRDRVSAQMARHTCQRILKELGELK
jgi:hypothetical protein